MPTTYSVKTALRLRKAPQITPDNIITTLAPGTIVTLVDGTPPVADWLPVTVTISGTVLTGYVSKTYVDEINPAQPPVPASAQQITAVNMPAKAGVGLRASTDGRAYPLNETNMPRRDATADSATKISAIYNILDYLDVESSPRYQPANGVTYCNIYAYDYGCLANVYLPRVWWTGKALSELARGNQQQIIYGDTVDELNANSLLDWFKGFGTDFGWNRLFDVNELQNQVNSGKAGIIVAQRTVLSRSGHILAVIPENGTNMATRANGIVTAPLQSQAGAKNKKLFTSQWYLSNNFREFGFWVHD